MYKVIICRVNRTFSTEHKDYKLKFNEETKFSGSNKACKAYIETRLKERYSYN